MYNGVFEVVKSLDLIAEGEFLVQCGSLDVVVFIELEGGVYIQVEVKFVLGNCIIGKKIFLI